MTRQAKHVQAQTREVVRRMTQPQAGALVTVEHSRARLAELLGADAAPSVKTIYGWAEHSDVSFWMGLALEAATGSTALCELHCQLRGGRFVEDVTHAESEATPLEVMHETSEALTAYVEMMPGGFTAMELARLRKEIADARTALDRLEQSAELAAV